MIGKTIEHYRIKDRLGSGGMKVVYRADDLKLGPTVALKFLSPELTLTRDPEAKKRFERKRGPPRSSITRTSAPFTNSARPMTARCFWPWPAMTANRCRRWWSAGR